MDNCPSPLLSEPCSSTDLSLVSLWLLIIICSLFINQLHLHRWGPAAKAVPWYEWLPQGENPALLTVRQCWWQRQPPATLLPWIHIAAFFFFVENEMKIKPTDTLQTAWRKPGQIDKWYRHDRDSLSQSMSSNQITELSSTWNTICPA